MEMKSVNNYNGHYRDREWPFSGNKTEASRALEKFRATIEEFEDDNIYDQYQIKTICSTNHPVAVLSRKKRPSFRSLNFINKTSPSRRRLKTDAATIQPSNTLEQKDRTNREAGVSVRCQLMPTYEHPLTDNFNYSFDDEEDFVTPNAENFKSRPSFYPLLSTSATPSSSSSSAMSSARSSLRGISRRYREDSTNNSSYEMERLISEPHYAQSIESYPDSYRRLHDTCLKCINLNGMARRCCSGSRLLASEMWPDRESTFFTEEENEILKPILYGTNITIVVAGQVNTGKSVLINLLLNAKVLPMDDYRCTTRCVRVVSRPDNDLPDAFRTQPSSVETLKANDNSEEDCLGMVRVKEWCGWQTSDSSCCNNIAQINMSVREKMKDLDSEDIGRNRKKWKFIEIELKSILVQNSISFVECPAIDGPKSYDEVDEFIKRNPLAIFLYLIADNDLVSQRDTSFINHLHHVHPDLNIFFVITKTKSDSMVEISQRDKFTSASCSSNSSPFIETNSQEEERLRVESIVKCLQNSECFPQQEFVLSDIDDDENLPIAILSPYDTIADLEAGVEKIGFLKFDLFLKKLNSFIKDSIFKLIEMPCNLLHTIIAAQTDMVYSLPKSVWEEIKQAGNLLKLMRDKADTYFESSIKRFAEILNFNKRTFIEKTTVHSDKWIQNYLEGLTKQSTSNILNELRFHIAEDLIIRMQDSLVRDKILIREIQKGRDELLKAIDRCIENFCEKMSSTHCGLGANLKRIKSQFKSIAPPQVKLYLDNNFEASRKSSVLRSNLLGKIGVWAWGIRGRHTDYASKRVRLSIAEEIFSKVAPSAQQSIAPNYKSIVSLLDRLLNTTMRYYEASRNPPFNPDLGMSHAQNRLMCFNILLEAIETNLNNGFPFLNELNIKDSAYYSGFPSCNRKLNMSITSMLSCRPDTPYSSDTYSLRVNYGSFETSNTIVRKFPTSSFSTMEKFINRLALRRLVHGNGTKLLHRPEGYCLDTSCQLIVFLPKLQTSVFHELVNNIGPQWNISQGFYITRQVARACQILCNYKELRQVDLRPENILLNYNSTRGTFHVTVRLSCLNPPNREQQYPNNTGPYHFLYSSSPSVIVNDSEMWDQQETVYQLAVLLWWLFTKRLQEPPNFMDVKTDDRKAFKQFLSSQMRNLDEISIKIGEFVISLFAKSKLKEMTLTNLIDDLNANLELPNKNI